MNKTELLDRWTTVHSEELYGIKNWGNDYFVISEKGEVNVTPYKQKQTARISLMDIVSGLEERGFEMPVLLRFENLLDSQIAFLNDSFRKRY